MNFKDIGNFIGQRAMAAKQWAEQNSPIVKAVKQKSLKPIGEGFVHAAANVDPVSMAMPMGVGSISSKGATAFKAPYFRHAPEQIQPAFNAFQAQIPKLKPLSEATKNMRIEQARSKAFNNLSAFNKIPRQQFGTSENRFRELISQYLNK